MKIQKLWPVLTTVAVLGGSFHAGKAHGIGEKVPKAPTSQNQGNMREPANTPWCRERVSRNQVMGSELFRTAAKILKLLAQDYMRLKKGWLVPASPHSSTGLPSAPEALLKGRLPTWSDRWDPIEKKLQDLWVQRGKYRLDRESLFAECYERYPREPYDPKKDPCTPHVDEAVNALQVLLEILTDPDNKDMNRKTLGKLLNNPNDLFEKFSPYFSGSHGFRDNRCGPVEERTQKFEEDAMEALKDLFPQQQRVLETGRAMSYWQHASTVVYRATAPAGWASGSYLVPVPAVDEGLKGLEFFLKTAPPQNMAGPASELKGPLSQLAEVMKKVLEIKPKDYGTLTDGEMRKLDKERTQIINAYRGASTNASTVYSHVAAKWQALGGQKPNQVIVDNSREIGSCANLIAKGEAGRTYHIYLGPLTPALSASLASGGASSVRYPFAVGEWKPFPLPPACAPTAQPASGPVFGPASVGAYAR